MGPDKKVTKVTGNPRFAAACFVLGSITGTFSILLLANPNFFKNLHLWGTISLALAIGFGILAYYVKGIENCQSTALTFAGICAISVINAIGHGIYPNSQRSSSLVTLALDPILFIAITWIALSGANAPIEMFQADVADQMANLPQQEFGVIDTMIEITINIFKGNPVKVNGVMPFPHLFLLLHMIWNFLKFMRSYSYWFLGASITTPFMIVIWLKHTPREWGIPVYIMITISLTILLTILISLKNHWKIEATS